MIPIKLQIKNFLSYGSEVQTIEFGNYPLICLSGKNGHGKSALLDAITWALWGQARKLSGIAKADQGLLRLGQTQMMVCLDFECAGQKYRIKREYMQTYGKPVSIVEFGLYDATHERFISLTDKTIRDTQSKIDQTLHLSYDSFINSAFLRQGQSNEFSKKSPKERKDVLGSILGLDQYENIRRLASERIKQTTTYKMHLTALNTKLEQELTQQPIIEEKLENTLKKLAEINATENELAVNQKNLEAQIAVLNAKKQELTLKNFEKQKISAEQQSLRQQLLDYYQEWRSIHKQHLTQVNYSQFESQKKQLLDAIKNHQYILQNQLMLKEELLETKEASTRFTNEFYEKKAHEMNTKKIAIERLQVEKEHLEKNSAEIKAAQERHLIAKSKLLEEITQLTKAIPETLTDHGALEKQFEKRKEHYQRWIAHANMINSEIAAINQKNKLVHDEESPSCPLCEQNLSSSRKRFLKKKFEDDLIFLKCRFSRLSTLIKNLKTILMTQHNQLEQAKKQAQEHQLITLKIEELGKTLASLQNQIADLDGNFNKFNELHIIIQITIENEQKALLKLEEKSKEELLLDKSYQSFIVKIKAIEDAVQSHAYNAVQHEQDMQKLTTIEKQMELHQKLQEQCILQNQRAEQVSLLCVQLKQIKLKLIDLEKIVDTENEIVHAEKKLLSEKQALADSHLHTTKAREALLQEKGSLENQRTKLLDLKKEFTQQKQEITTCNATIDDYQTIAQATGKDGIQALLIEDAIPEIEQEANDLLSKLTDNQTQLFIESLRDLKKGGTKETLDIKISDAVGIRPYELFSGGEAFRIDFALRIAISKLLARRAGTSLQTLIIDEGFGSQDEDGLSHIMDSLYKIQDDFSKIIVVSHLSVMKNQFPVHFVIEKSPQGSIVQVIEQG